MTGASRTKRIVELNDELHARVGFPRVNGLGNPSVLAIITVSVLSLTRKITASYCRPPNCGFL